MGGLFQDAVVELSDANISQSACSQVKCHSDGCYDDKDDGAEKHVRQLFFNDFVVIS
jgi:hypothetical protein